MTLPELASKWDGAPDESRPEWVRIPLEFTTKRTDGDPPEAPEVFVDWASFPSDDRPEIAHDTMCHVLGRFMEHPNGSDIRSGTSLPPRWLVNESFDLVVAEHERQTGVALDWRSGEWPHIFFADHFFLMWCHGYSGAPAGNETIEVHCLSSSDGHG